MHISNSAFWFDDKQIKQIEEHYNASYMGAWCTKHENGAWTSRPLDVFYVENPDVSKGHKHYFGMFARDGKVYITDATSAFDTEICGVLCEDGEVLVSRYRHDYQAKKDAMVDGGRDYFKHGGNKPVVAVSVDKNNFVFKIMENV